MTQFQKRSLSSRVWRMRKRTVLIKRRKTTLELKKAKKVGIKLEKLDS